MNLEFTCECIEKEGNTIYFFIPVNNNFINISISNMSDDNIYTVQISKNDFESIARNVLLLKVEECK